MSNDDTSDVLNSRYIRLSSASEVNEEYEETLNRNFNYKRSRIKGFLEDQKSIIYQKILSKTEE